MDHATLSLPKVRRVSRALRWFLGYEARVRLLQLNSSAHKILSELPGESTASGRRRRRRFLLSKMQRSPGSKLPQIARCST